MRGARRKAAFPKRRIIMNNGGNDCRRPSPSDPRPPESFLAKRTMPLLGSQVDAIFYCTGVFNSYTHQSEETVLRTDKPNPGTAMGCWLKDGDAFVKLGKP